MFPILPCPRGLHGSLFYPEDSRHFFGGSGSVTDKQNHFLGQEAVYNSFSKRLAEALDAVIHIFPVSAPSQMLRIATSRVVAGVKAARLIFWTPLPRKPERRRRGSKVVFSEFNGKACFPVPVFVERRLPQPAIIWTTDSYAAPKIKLLFFRNIIKAFDSHGAVLSRGGQGGAALVALTPPACTAPPTGVSQ